MDARTPEQGVTLLLPRRPPLQHSRPRRARPSSSRRRLSSRCGAATLATVVVNARWSGLLVAVALPLALTAPLRAAPPEAEHVAAVESFRRGTQLVEAGQMQQAIDAFREALRHEPRASARGSTSPTATRRSARPRRRGASTRSPSRTRARRGTRARRWPARPGRTSRRACSSCASPGRARTAWRCASMPSPSRRRSWRAASSGSPPDGIASS